MFRGHHRRVRILFGLSDIVLTALAFQAAYWLRYTLGANTFTLERDFYLSTPVHVLLLGVSLLLWVAPGAWLKIYDRIDAAHPRVILRDALRQCLVGGVGIVLFQFILRLNLSRTFLILFVVAAWVFMCLFRLNAGRLLGVVRREFGAPSFVMVVGLGEAALRLGRQIEDAADYGIRLVGFLSGADDAETVAPVQLGAAYKVWALEELPRLLREQVIDEIIFAVDSRKLASLEEYFLLCDEEGVRTRVAVDFFPHVNSNVYLDRLGTLPLLTFSAAPHDEIRLLVKRSTDVALAAAALVLLWPVMILVALLIRVSSPGPVIFRQIRCGLNGRRFVFYKFRSMCENAEAMRAELEQQSHREIAMKIHNDPRLTGLGRWLRKFSIDEWPQLWNVLKGDMSLVGPRPPLPEEVEQYKQWQRRRLRMRPGLTCLWAVKGRDRVDFETWMKMDMQYIDNWSLALDWEIILRTIPQVLSGRGAH